jgi:HEPN domain-containing protein
MNRKTLKELAGIRLKEARALLKVGLYSGAYYLSGYVIECGLKACIAKLTKRYEFPDKRRVQDSYTHDLEVLVKVANLQPALEAEMKADAQFRVNWGIAKDWDENSRYEKHAKSGAQDLYNAVQEPTHGMLQWIKRFW